MKILYAVLALIGLVLPYTQFIVWINQNGLNIPLMFSEIADSRLSMFAWLDVVVSAIVLIVFIYYEGNKLHMKKLWIPIVATLSVGVSFGLPLFLYMREDYRT